MAKGMNKVVLLGHVGKDPEIRATQGGTTVANLSLATADRQKQGEEWVDKTEWHNLVAFQRTAEVVRDYVEKGSQIMIEGKLQTRSWEDEESGQKKSRTEIIINDLTLLGGGQGRDNANGASQSSSHKTNGKSGYSSSGSIGYMTNLKGHKTPKAYLDDQFTFAGEHANLRVLRSALVQMKRYYAAVERTDETGKRHVFAVVCLVNYNLRAKEALHLRLRGHR
jgi:single-strand DNA-binding protein